MSCCYILSWLNKNICSTKNILSDAHYHRSFFDVCLCCSKHELGAVLWPSFLTLFLQAHWAHKHWWCAPFACSWCTFCNSSPQQRLPKSSLLQQLSWSNLSRLIDDTLSSRLISSYDSSWQPHCYWTMLKLYPEIRFYQTWANFSVSYIFCVLLNDWY